MKIKNTNSNIKTYIAALLSLSFLNGGEVKSDSTFFPEDKTAEKPKLEGSEAIKEWAELKPTPKEPTKLIPQPQTETTEASLTNPEEESTSTTANTQEQKAAETLATLPESNTTITETPETLTVAEEKKSTEPTKTGTSITKVAETPSPIEEKKPLEVTKVVARPKAVPVQEEPQAASNGKAPGKVISYSDAANDRSPLGILSPHQEVHNQRWYIYSSAIRGLKNPSDNIQIVSMVGTPAKRGEDIKNLLIEMGIEAEKVQLINAKGEEDQAGTIYIFAGK
jgi:hypothetical protein